MGMKYSADVMSEADLLAEFYHRCKLSGITARLEVFMPSLLHRSKRMRVDVAIFRGNEIVACVEGKTPGAKIGGNTRQKNAYDRLQRQYGIEVHWLNSFAQLDPLVQKLGKLVQFPGPPPTTPEGSTAPRSERSAPVAPTAVRESVPQARQSQDSCA